MTAATQAAPPTPPLVDGERLTRDEFERRYHAMPEVKKAELIDGVVHMPSPVSMLGHGEPHAHLISWMGTEPQPDSLLLIDPARGGRTEFTDGYVTGGPELAGEVAASSLSIDRGAKFRAYRRNGVCEYILWRVEDGAIDWFILRDGEYHDLAPGPDGIIRGEAFPGLWLDVAAVPAADLVRVIAVLQLGIASPEHAAFVAGLPPAP